MHKANTSVGTKLQKDLDPMDSDLNEMYDELDVTPEDLVEEMMDMIVYQLSRRMKELNWTQKDLAAAMDVSPPLVSRLMRASNTSLLTVAKAARALGLSFRAIKLVPDEDVFEQIDELKSFVQTERSTKEWWPATRYGRDDLRRLTEMETEAALEE